MHRNLKIAWLAIACLVVASSAEITKDSDQHHIAQSAEEKAAAAIKAEFGDNVDVSFEGYEGFLAKRDDGGEDGSVLGARDGDEDSNESDNDLAAQHAQALADDDEDYDALPDGVDEETYRKELEVKDAEDNTIPVRRREAEAEAEPDPIVLLTAAQKKRLGRMRPHYVKHAERLADDLKQFMKRFADDPNGGDQEIDVSLEGYDHDLVRREFAGIDDGDNEWEEPQEELKGYDHSKLVEGEDGLSPEKHTQYLKQWNAVVARDFEELEEEDNDDHGNDRYVAPEDTEFGSTEKRGLTRLQKMRKGVKVLIGYEN